MTDETKAKLTLAGMAAAVTCVFAFLGHQAGEGRTLPQRVEALERRVQALEDHPAPVASVSKVEKAAKLADKAARAWEGWRGNR